MVPLVSAPQATYVVLDPLRVGALTQTFRAQRIADDGPQQVLLKQLLPALATDPEVRGRWLSRANANTRVRHSSCVRVFDAREIDSRAYVAVEPVDGVGLDVLLRKYSTDNALAFAATYIARGILEALADVLDAEPRCAHLDICPESVIIRPDGTLALTEFSLWEALDPAEAARARFDKNRVAHLSPEVARSLGGDCRSDVFSTGALLYELLTGKRAFRGATQLMLALAISEGKRAPIHEIWDQGPSDLLDIVETMLAHDPDRRFQNARAALNALSSVCSIDPDVPTRLGKLVCDVQQEREERRKSPFFIQEPQTLSLRADGQAVGPSAVPRLSPLAQTPKPPASPPDASAGLSPSEPALPQLDASEPLAPPPLLMASPAPLEPALVADLPAKDGRTAFFRRVTGQHKVPSPLPPPPVIAGQAPAPAPLQELGLVEPPGAALPEPPFSAPLPVDLVREERRGLGQAASPLQGVGLVGSPRAGRPELSHPSPPPVDLIGADRSGAGQAPAPLDPPSAGPLPGVAPPPWRGGDEEFREPTATLFQVKSYALSATRRAHGRLPTGMTLVLALVFGFATVVGSYFLFRLWN